MNIKHNLITFDFAKTKSDKKPYNYQQKAIDDLERHFIEQKNKKIHNLWYNELNLDNYLKQKLSCLVIKYEQLKTTDEDMKKYEKDKSLFKSTDENIKGFEVDTSKCTI